MLMKSKSVVKLSCKSFIKKPEKYEHIINQASLLFAHNDFHNVCMEDVAAAAKVGKGTLYNYFNSKDDLYYSILHYQLEKLLVVLENAYNGRYDFLRNMKSLILHLSSFMASHPYFHQIWIREENSLERNGNLLILKLKKRVFNLIKKVLLQGVDDKLLNNDLNADFTVQVVYSIINNSKYNKEQIDMLFPILMKGIGKGGLDISVNYKSYKHKKR